MRSAVNETAARRGGFFITQLKVEEVKPILKLAALAAVVLAAGCAPHPHKKWEPLKPDPMLQARDASGATTGQLESYAVQIRDAIQAKMPPGEYTGMICTLRLQLARDGMVISANAEEGERQLCDAALKAVQTAQIPPAPSDKVYSVFKDVPLDFKY